MFEGWHTRLYARRTKAIESKEGIVRESVEVVLKSMLVYGLERGSRGQAGKVSRRDRL